MIRTFQYKLQPNRSQAKCLDRWLGTLCWLFNRMLEQRQKAYSRRAESPSYQSQSALLTAMRGRIDSLRGLPVMFARDALRRVDLGLKAFFRRVKAGQAPGFPRFKSRHRYNSMEYLAAGKYLRGDRVHVPGLGSIPCRGRLLPEGNQKALRIIRKPSGWYAQIVLDDGKPTPEAANDCKSAVGIDVGLEHFATTSDGEHIANPRFGRRAQRKLRSLQRRVSRRQKGSNRRRRAVKRLARHHERIADQRRTFCHQHSTALVRQHDLIAVEKLNVCGMARGRFAKSIMDAAWGIFTTQLTVKAADAGRRVVFVNPRGTSQECPDCGRVKKKLLSERVHSCDCGLRCQRDTAAARVILDRALGVSGVTRTRTDSTADSQPVCASSGPDET